MLKSIFKIATVCLSLLSSNGSFAQQIPEFEGVYARTATGDLLELNKLSDISQLTKISLAVGQTCNNCIPISTGHGSISVLPFSILLQSDKRIDRRKITGFVIKTRRAPQRLFLDRIVEVKSFTRGQLILERQQNSSSRSPIGTLFEYVESARNSGKPTNELDTKDYKFPNPIASRRGEDPRNHLIDKIPPYLSLANCGSNEANFNIKPIDQFTTEYVWKGNNLSDINLVNKFGECAETTSDPVPIYGLALSWSGSVYPLMSKTDFQSYT